MSRQTYTFKIDEEKIKTKLLQAMQSKQNFSPTFSEYLESHKNNFKSSYYDISAIMEYDNIVKCLQNGDFPIVEHMGIAFDWLWEVLLLGEVDLEGVLGEYGFELIYEVGAKDRCWVYLNQMAEFCYHAGLEDEVTRYDGMYYLHTNKVYKYSISYLITILSLLCLENNETKNWYDFEELEILKKNTENNFLVAIAEKELVYIRENNQIAKIKGQEYRRDPDESHHLVAEHLLSEINEIQKSIADYKGKIFIFDSN